MRTVRSFDPCLPCGVHVYIGEGKMLERVHSPMLGVGGLRQGQWFKSGSDAPPVLTPSPPRCVGERVGVRGRAHK